LAIDNDHSIEEIATTILQEVRPERLVY